MNALKEFDFEISGDFEEGSDPYHSSWGIRSLYILTEVYPKQKELVVSELNDPKYFDTSKWFSTVGGQ